MATSVYFNNFQSSQEQLLIEDLVIESIKIYGHDVYYLPRYRNSFDTIYGEDPLSEFKNALFIEMYIKNVDGFDGDGDFISKFGLEIRDRVTFTVSRRVFSEEVGNQVFIERPREGDLLYFPLNNKVFEIKFVEHEAIFYQLGSLQTFDLVCELFEFSEEKFKTGVPQIDNLFSKSNIAQQDYTTAITNYAFLTEDANPYALLDEDGFRLLNEQANESVIGDNDAIQNETDDFIDFSEMDPFSEGTY